MNFKVNSQLGLSNLGVDDFKNVQDQVQTSSAQDSNDFVKQYQRKEIDKAVNNFNKLFEQEKTHAEVSVHEKFNTIMVKIVNDENGEVLMEVPPKKILDMVAKMCELSGVVFDKTI